MMMLRVGLMLLAEVMLLVAIVCGTPLFIGICALGFSVVAAITIWHALKVAVEEGA